MLQVPTPLKAPEPSKVTVTLPLAGTTLPPQLLGSTVHEPSEPLLAEPPAPHGLPLMAAVPLNLKLRDQSLMALVVVFLMVMTALKPPLQLEAWANVAVNPAAVAACSVLWK